ncbi:hypothetical protein [Bacillus sp. T3]|uniref:hypothetical protein n=1 Tax=Bacillus sp. T3 TaxID=467262 RepID=UPI002981BD6F|nr:hypothetical protein [Bacillus sp. T3]
MKTKKIIADSMPHALKMVRQELGENAIIVNTAVIKTGGVFGLFAKQKYEVTAYAIDNDGDQPEPKFSVEFREKPKINIPIQNNHEKYNQQNYEEKENNSSVFHSKPQRLYQYYSQPNAEEGKKDVGISTSAERNMRKEELFQLQMEEYQPSIKTNQRQIERPYKADEQSKPVVQHQPPQNEKNEQLLDEIQQMRKMMMNFMMNEQQGSTLPAVVTKWTNHLKKQGVEEEIIQHILDEILKKHNDIGQLDESVFKQELAISIEQIIAKKIPSSISVGKKLG